MVLYLGRYYSRDGSVSYHPESVESSPPKPFQLAADFMTHVFRLPGLHYMCFGSGVRRFDAIHRGCNAVLLLWVIRDHATYVLRTVDALAPLVLERLRLGVDYTQCAAILFVRYPDDGVADGDDWDVMPDHDPVDLTDLSSPTMPSSIARDMSTDGSLRSPQPDAATSPPAWHPASTPPAPSAPE